jgi:hypothetical protein
VSVSSTKALYDNTRAWKLTVPTAPPAGGGKPTPPKGNDVELSTPVGPDRSDPKTQLLAGEAMNRGGYAYWAIMPGGPIAATLASLLAVNNAQAGTIASLTQRITALENAAPKA